MPASATASPDGGGGRSGELAGLEEVLEGGLVDDRDVVLLGLGDLGRAGAVADDEGEVLALTLPGLVPPRATIASVAPSRLNPPSVPDTTTALPASVWGCSGPVRSGALPKSTPAARSFSMNARLLSRSNHVRIDAAITPPTPGDGGEVLGGRVHHRVEGAERRRQHSGGGRARGA